MLRTTSRTVAPVVGLPHPSENPEVRGAVAEAYELEPSGSRG